MVKYCVLWKEKRKNVNSLRPEWSSFKNKAMALSFARTIKRDPAVKEIKVRKCKR